MTGIFLEGLAKEQLDEAISKDDTRPDIEVSGGSDDNTSGAYWRQPGATSCERPAS